MEHEYVVEGQLWGLVRQARDVLVLPEQDHTIIRQPFGDICERHPGGLYRLAGYEFGGGTTNKGSACVIASFSGKPLLPVEVYRRGEIANGRHAKFISNGPPLVEIYARRERDHVRCSIEVWPLDPRSTWGLPVHIPYLEHSTDGIDPTDIPPYLEHLAEAIIAAAEKSACYHCDGVHFMEHAEGHAHIQRSAPVR